MKIRNLTFARDPKDIPVSSDSWYLAHGTDYSYSVRYDDELGEYRFGVWTRHNGLLVDCKACCACDNRAHGMLLADTFEMILDIPSISDVYKRLAIARDQVNCARVAD
jgi:hypothetical protein